MVEPNAAPPQTPSPAAAYAPIAGITRTMDQPADDPSESIRTSVAGQSISGVLFLAALLPPIVLALVLSLSGNAGSIPYSAMWAWGAFVLAFIVVARGVVFLLSGPRAATVGALAGAFVLLLVPSVVVLILRLRLSPMPFALGVTQIILYALGAIALLTARTSLN